MPEANYKIQMHFEFSVFTFAFSTLTCLHIETKCVLYPLVYQNVSGGVLDLLLLFTNKKIWVPVEQSTVLDKESLGSS